MVARERGGRREPKRVALSRPRSSGPEQDQSPQPRRRARRRRDDAHHLALHQRQAHPAVSRRRPEVLRPRHRAPRRDRRPGHARRGPRDQAVRRRREVRHDHARRGARRGVPPQEDVEVAQRHDPQRARRHGLPRADHLPQRAAPGAGLDPADRDRPPRLRRPVPRDRLRRAGPGQADDHLRARRRRRDDRARGLPVQGPRRLALDVQRRRVDPRLRPREHELRSAARLAGLSLDQEHDPQVLRRALQGHLPAGLRGRVQGRVRRARADLRAPPDRRHGRLGAQVVGRVRVGLQELRRRRAVRHGRAGLRVARPDDVGADDARRQDDRGRGRARHGDPPLPRAPEGPRDLDQPDRLDLRLDARPRAPRQGRRHARGDALRRDARAGLRRDRRGRQDDQGSRDPDRPRPALADHQRSSSTRSTRNCGGACKPRPPASSGTSR